MTQEITEPQRKGLAAAHKVDADLDSTITRSHLKKWVLKLGELHDIEPHGDYIYCCRYFPNLEYDTMEPLRMDKNEDGRCFILTHFLEGKIAEGCEDLEETLRAGVGQKESRAFDALLRFCTEEEGNIEYVGLSEALPDFTFPKEAEEKLEKIRRAMIAAGKMEYGILSVMMDETVEKDDKYEIQHWYIVPSTVFVGTLVIRNGLFCNTGPEGGEYVYQEDIGMAITRPDLVWRIDIRFPRTSGVKEIDEFDYMEE